METWRRQTRVDVERRITVPMRGTLADNVERYLRAVTTMRTYQEHRRHLVLWCEVFGHRLRGSITGDEIWAT